LIGIDADESAIKIAQDNLKDFQDSFKLINDNFENLDRILPKEGVERIDAILFDLGLSSYQIEDDTRGFSIKRNSRLDMRMDTRLRVTAYDIVNRYKESSLSQIIERFGEEPFHKRIARFIVSERSKRPIETTHELATIIHRAVSHRYKNSKIDPATRTFQALRIAVNRELESLENGLKKAISYLAPKGRICVISFHSLEDRIVKRIFKGYSDLGVLKILAKKPITPSREEILFNPRSRSAKLRIAERME
jgi:16S rRNA (cytosine1402-N4)-methyltransferase